MTHQDLWLGRRRDCRKRWLRRNYPKWEGWAFSDDWTKKKVLIWMYDHEERGL